MSTGVKLLCAVCCLFLSQVVHVKLVCACLFDVMDWKCALWRAAQQGRAGEVRNLALASNAQSAAQSDAQLWSCYKDAMQVACCNDWPDVVIALLDAKVDCTPERSLAIRYGVIVHYEFLHSAAWVGSKRAVSVLLHARADANSDIGFSRSDTPLMRAAQSGHVGTTLLLLQAKARLDASAVSRAASSGRVAALSVLLRAKASPSNIKTEEIAKLCTPKQVPKRLA